MIHSWLIAFNNFLKSFWLSKPNFGLRRLILIFAVFTLVTIATLSSNIPQLFVPATIFLVGFLMTIAWFILVNGYYHRIKTFEEFNEIVEVVDFIKPLNKKDSIRYIKPKAFDFKYGKAFLDPKQNLKECLYLPAVFEIVQHWFKKRSVRALFLGGGAQILPLHIAAKRKDIIDVVEISEKFISVAKEYFYPLFNNKPKSINTYAEDGLSFVGRAGKRYDYVFQDIFQNQKIPRPFYSTEWLGKLSFLIKKSGLLLMNLGFDTEKDSFKKLYTIFRWANNQRLVFVFSYKGSVLCLLSDRRNTKKFNKITKRWSNYSLELPDSNP